MTPKPLHDPLPTATAPAPEPAVRRTTTGPRPAPWWALPTLPTLALLAACGGGASDALTTPATMAPLHLAAPAERGARLPGDWSAYPRLVRLAHQADPARNGRILASVIENAGGVFQPAFHASDDDGASFTRQGWLADTTFATGVCCGTLFEMPQTVGVLPAGTLLYAASVGYDVPGTLMAQYLYRSDDGGTSFRRIEQGDCGRSAVPYAVGSASGLWEPEFLVTAGGALACIFSDETEPGRSQVLKLTQTRDGLHWSVPQVIVAGPEASDRPGMAVVRRLPGGRYVMSFEACSTARPDCSARLKHSDDGVHWGPLGTLGERPQTATGHYFRHAPTIAWSATPAQPQGVLALIGQIVASDRHGADAATSGRVLMISSSADGQGDWRMVAAPIGLPAAPLQTNWCQNYSTPLLPSADGSQLLMVQTDHTEGGGCIARFGRGRLGG